MGSPAVSASESRIEGQLKRSLASFLRLPGTEQRLLIRAAITLVIAKAAVKTMPLGDARRTVTRLQRRRVPAPSPSPERIGWVVATAGRIAPGLRNCLVQALAAEALLIRAGYACELKIGAAKTGTDELTAHAWVERDGTILVGAFEANRFRPLTAPVR